MGASVVDAEALASVAERFRKLVDRQEVDALQKHGATAICTPYLTAYLMVLQRVRGNATLEEAVAVANREGLFAPLPDGAPRRMSAGNSGFSRARARLDLKIAEAVSQRLGGGLVAAAPPSFAGRRVFVVDGTTLSLRPEDKLRRVYPPAQNQHGEAAWPTMHAAMAFELSSGCALRPELGAMYGEKRVSEMTLGTRLLARIPEGALVLADRNFGVFYFAYAAWRTNRHFVARLTKARFAAMRRRATPLGDGRWELRWTPTAQDRQGRDDLPSDAVVPVHLHEVDAVNDKDEPTKLWLATTLTEVEATGAAWGRLYRERWKGENDIRDVKKALKIDEMRGRAPDMVTKEWWLGLAAHNLTIQVRRIAAAAGNRQPRDLSFKGTLSLVAELLAPKDTAPEEYLRLFATTIAGALQRKLPKRPDRHHPRTVLARGQKYPKRHPKKLEERPRQ